MLRQKLIDCFQDTLEMSKSRVLEKKTSEAIKSNKVYKEEFVSKIPKRNEFSPISVHEGTTFEIAKKYRQFGQIVVLNFANPEYPGGGVWNGAMAQEECLCRSSNLYACISNANVFDEYYAYHRNISNQFYTDRLIYTKNVTVFKNDDMIPRILPKKEWFDVDVITCAAPYLGARKYTNSTVLLTLFKSRIKNIFEAAKDNCVDVIVLGAFGCGAFKNPPKLVAQAFYQVIREQDYFKDFKQIVFAIKSTSEFCPNLSAFIQQFDQYAADARLRCSILPEPPEWRFCRMPVFLSEISNDMKGKFYSWQKNNRYFGKQFSILGDSISTLDGYNPKGYQVFYSGENYIQSGVEKMSDTWWDQVISFFGGELLVNNSWSGSRVTKIPQINQLFPSGCSDERTSTLHINNLKPDVIIVYLGTNDWAFSVTTGNDTYILGEDRHERFDDAYSAMLRKIKKNYPDSELWCCTLCTTYMSSNPEFQFPHKYGGTHIEEYNEIIRRIVRENGCILIDLYAYNQPYDTMDGTHPNEKGMQTLAQLILCEKSGADMAILFSSVKEQMAYVLPVEEINMQEESEYVMLPSGITSVLYSDTLSLTFENAGGTVKFKKTEVHVGRDSSNDFCFTENIHVELKHATFFYENQSWFLRDNGSINGTWINDKCIKSWKKYQLSANDEIRFANSGKVIFYKLQNLAQQSETQFEGTIINGRYRVLHLLMPEGNNQCYMVYDDNFNRNLIMEVYDMRNKNDSLKMRNIILQDIHRWMSVKHSLIQEVEYVENENYIFIFKEYVKGKTLDVILKENGPVSVYTAIEFVRQLCDAFHHLHSQTSPYIYGNMRPSDVIVKPDGEFILTSHGTARAMDFNLNMMREAFTCVLMPSSGYSAPEMYRGFEQADERTDIYTLGVLMYYLLTGHDLSIPPYEMYPIRQWNTEFPKELEKIILKCTQKNPVERYQSCAELLSALEGVLTCENRKMNLFDRIFNRA